MATVDKNFRIKNGLAVEGTTATVNGKDILTKDTGDSYIINLIGGSADTANTANTVVKRDGSGAFAAGTVTVTDINIGTIGHIWDDGDLIIANTDNQDVILQGEDIRLNAQDDVRLNAGTGGDVFIQATSGNINLQGPNVYVGENLGYTDAERVASQGYVDDAIANIDLSYTTDDVTEGSSLYFTDFRAQTAVSNALGTGLSYGDQGSGNVFHVDENHISTKAYADAAADAAYSNAQGYAELKASDAQAAAIEAASQDATTKANNAQAAAEDYTDTAVAGLVGSAPQLLDTIQELATALENNPDIIADLETVAAGKQDTLTAGSNIDITGSTISVTGLATSSQIAEDIAGSFLFTSDGELNVDSEGIYDDFVNGGMATTTNISDAIATEVTNRDGAIQSAVNDLVDGTTALNKVNISSVSSQVAGSGTVSPAGTYGISNWKVSDYKSAKLLIKRASGAHTEVSEILLTLDSSNNIAITEYGIVGTNGTIGTISANISSVSGQNYVNVTIETVNETTDYTVFTTLLV